MAYYIRPEIEAGPRIRYDSPAAEALTEDERNYMMCEQFNTCGKPDMDTWLTTWYGPVGTPDRDAEDAKRLAEREARLAKPGNIDETFLNEVLREIEKQRNQLWQNEQDLFQAALSKSVKYLVGTVIDVLPQPKKRSLPHRLATRFLVVDYKVKTAGQSYYKLSNVWVSMRGVFLDAEGKMIQPAGNPETGRPLKEGEYVLYHISLNTSGDVEILGVSGNQEHQCHHLPEIKALGPKVAAVAQN
jgi:hypothetical protein